MIDRSRSIGEGVTADAYFIEPIEFGSKIVRGTFACRHVRNDEGRKKDRSVLRARETIWKRENNWISIIDDGVFVIETYTGACVDNVSQRTPPSICACYAEDCH